MHGDVEHVDADDGAPEVARQQADVEERRAAHAEDQRRDAVEDEEREVEAGDVPADGGRPRGVAERGPVEDGRLGAVDDDAPEREHGDHLVRGALGHEELLQRVGEAVEGGAKQAEEVALELVLGGEVVGVRDLVRREEDAHAGDAGQDAADGGHAVAHVQREERDDDDDNDGPEVDQLRGQDRGVAEAEDGEVVTLDVEERENEVCAR